MTLEEFVDFVFSLVMVGGCFWGILSVGCVDVFEVLVIPEFVIVLVASAIPEVWILFVELILVECVEILEVKLDFLVVEAALFLSILEWVLIQAVIDLVICWGPVNFHIAVVLYLVLVSLSIRLLPNLEVRLLHVLRLLKPGSLPTQV